MFGLLNAAVPFTLIAFAKIEITASLAAILNSTTVLFSALVAAAWIGDPLTGQKIFGVVLGTTGVTVLLGLDPLPLNGHILLAVGASLGALLRDIRYLHKEDLCGGQAADPCGRTAVWSGFTALAPRRRNPARRGAVPAGCALRVGARRPVYGGPTCSSLP